MESNIGTPDKTSNHPSRPQSSFLSLPEDIVLSCLARISRSYYPKLSLVSKSFRSLVLSNLLYKIRSKLQTQEECVYLGLQPPNKRCPIWFSLWIKHDDQTLNQCCNIQEKSTGNLLVPVPSSYTPFPPNLISTKVGSEIYTVGSHIYPSSLMWVRNEQTGNLRKAPSMMVARMEAHVCVLGEKIYVMGGCRPDESMNWAEVFDPKTQTWEPLPDPGPEVRFSLNKKIIPMDGMIYVTTKKKNVESKKKRKNVESKNKKKDFIYLLEEKKWEVVKNNSRLLEHCVIENEAYTYAHKKCWWREIASSEEWRLVNGLTGLDAYVINDTEIGTYGGKLLIFWDSPTLSPLDQTKKIWCAVILLDKSLNDEVSGQIEWVDVVHTVPVSYTLLDCVELLT